MKGREASWEGRAGLKKLDRVEEARGPQAGSRVWPGLRHHWAGLCWLLAQANTWPEPPCL